MRPPWVCLLLIGLLTYADSRQQVVYQNQFAVHVPAGGEVADSIARKHHFHNIGQIGSLPGYYLFEHNHVDKRSALPSNEHHNKLRTESQVTWVQQQHERVRRKRDRPIGLQFDPNRAQRSSSMFPDPLFKEQWYLNGGAKDGLDMNVAPAWNKGYTGRGIVVSILDDGIQTNHPDLIHNYDALASADINENDSDPTPRDNGDNKHGTRCAGEVAAGAFNQHCGVGVAYNASIGGVRMLDGTVNDAVEARALGLNPDHIDVYSASWGPEDDGKTVDGPGPLARRAFIHGVTKGRKGKGSIFVWASGNGGSHTDSCNCDGYTNSIFTLSISSATQGGWKPWYLEECSSTLATTYSSGTPGQDRSVATVDMDPRLRPDKLCTLDHTGTSASAPLAAGIAALALQANPDLTWRDVQYLVVLTSRPAPLRREAGWVTNGANRKVSHKFGYGLMDAGAIVSLAEQWTNVPLQHICKSQEVSEDRQIEVRGGSTLVAHMDVTGCSGTLSEVQFLEHVQCRVTMRFLPRGNLRLVLTSPSGTSSTLLFERPRDVLSASFDDWPFLSVHFWGEGVEGRWTLQVVNGGGQKAEQPGLLKKWQLIFYGTSTNPIRLKSSANESSETTTLHQPISPAVRPSSGDQTDLKSFNSDVYSSGGDQRSSSVLSSLSDEEKSYQENMVGTDSDGGKVLYSCDQECDHQGCYGQGPAQCVSCRRYKLDDMCVSQCPPRSFPNHDEVCRPCHESCETCAGAGQDSCLTCAPAHMYVTDLAVCLQQCPEGYYEDSDRNLCVPCEPNCASCVDKSNNCVNCEHHLVLHDSKCFATCPLHTHETEDSRCVPCHSSCETCNGSSETQCISCGPAHFSLAGVCHSVCPQGYYSHRKRRECLQCPPGCDTCNSTLCLTCDQGWILDGKGRCLPQGNSNCYSGEYWEGGHCRTCHSTCETCDGPNEYSCLSCPSPLLLQGSQCLATCLDGSYLDQGVCVPCLHTCKRCTSRVNCSQCAPGLFLQSGECRANCAKGYYSDQGVCEKCYLSCTTCSGPRKDHCINCPQGWKLAAGECQPECPEGFYSSNFGCNRCHHFCRSCKGEGPLNCTSCPPHYMPQGGLCTRCLSSQYYEATTQTCGPCHDSCKTCAGPNAFSCVTCLSPLQLDTFSQKCVKCCRGGQRKSCCHCDKITGTCHNSSPAGKRRKAVSADQTLRKDHDYHKDSGGTTEELVPFDAMAPLIGSACVAIVMLSVLVLAILQGRSRLKCKLWRSGDGYKRLSTEQSCVNADKEVTAPECDNVTDTNIHNEELQFMKI